MTSFRHAAFGDITLRRSARTHRISVRFDPKGQMVVTAPRLMPLFLVKRTISDSLAEIRKLQDKQPRPTVYRDGETIGHKRTLHFIPAKAFRTTVSEQQIVIAYPETSRPGAGQVQNYVSEQITKILRQDARIYLTSRLAILATRYNYHYQRLRFSNASTRWGSCSSSGTISLNIALMRLPLDLIDYVLVHELCHTIEMNHSKAFWANVGAILPNYRSLRTRIKRFTTSL